MAPDFDQIIAETLQELKQRVKERTEVDKRIGQLTKALRGLAPMLPERDQAAIRVVLKASRRMGLGLTEVILSILAESDEPLNANQVRERMEEMGFDFTEYSQASATIYNTLRRLQDSGRVMPLFSKDGAKTVLYKLAGKKNQRS